MSYIHNIYSIWQIGMVYEPVAPNIRHFKNCTQSMGRPCTPKSLILMSNVLDSAFLLFEKRKSNSNLQIEMVKSFSSNWNWNINWSQTIVGVLLLFHVINSLFGQIACTMFWVGHLNTYALNYVETFLYSKKKIKNVSLFTPAVHCKTSPQSNFNNKLIYFIHFVFYISIFFKWNVHSLYFGH